MKPVYLDYNATTPIDTRVGDAMIPYIREHFGNPSSTHPYGREAKEAVDTARHQVAQMLGCSSDEIVFTSGGTESNNWAIKGTATALRAKGNHIVSSAVEHPAVTEVCQYLKQQGFDITFLPVDTHGLVDPADVERAITPATILITIMHANNEVGTIEPIEDIAHMAKQKQIAVHTDAAQSIGKVKVNVNDLEVDLLSIAGHKLYAPKGIGAMYIRKGTKLEKLMHGASHESERRAGTENVIEIAGLGEACRMVTESLPSYSWHMAVMRDTLENRIRAAIPDAKINGHPQQRLPNTASISFKGIEANKLLDNLPGVAASAGSACHSDKLEVSSVLKAMNVPLDYAMGTIRFSVGRHTTTEDIESASRQVIDAVKRLAPR